MIVRENLKFYATLFWSTFYISLFTFGGGYVIVPLLRKRFVDRYHWIDEEEMIDLIAIAQASPGPLAVNVAILVGYRLKGVVGSIVTILATILPPFFILSIISTIYSSFIKNTYINGMLKGMQAGVAAVILSVVLDMVKEGKEERNNTFYIVLVAAFLASFLFQINVAFIIIGAAFTGGINEYQKKRKRSGKRL
ncbi:chromate transporter [Candidatus Galacturonibacter soehngenii]|uniref:Chromate transporter n=1 Tax=Candidatus Galacturonatibacter soehngenii TaxID=2307010 RepID=A0A7V7UBN8_9FIRM|nr:chromate transporter [Candidatus Galacturonibacter soehngenii]